MKICRIILAVAATLVSGFSAQAGNSGVNSSTPGSTLSINGNLAVGPTFATLAADVDGALFESQLGIGTAAPESDFHLFSSGVAVAVIEGGNSAYLHLQNFSSTAGGNRIFLESAGSVDFQIYNDIYTNNTGGLSFLNYRTGTHQLAVYGSRVGMGTPNPATDFHLYGGGSTVQLLQGSAGAYLYLQNDSGSSARTSMRFHGPHENFSLGSAIEGGTQHSFFIVDDLDQTVDLVIQENGFVGLNTTTPRCFLDIQRSGTSQIASGSAITYFNYTITAFSQPAATNNFAGGVGFLSEDNVMINGFYVSTNATLTASDKRLKNVIGKTDKKADLETLKKIKIVDYTLKDFRRDGTGLQKKVIAQQVEKVYPQAVYRIGMKDVSFIHDVYQDSQSVQADGTNYTITLAAPHGLQEGDKVCIRRPGKIDIYPRVHITGKDRFTITSQEPLGESVFVYGRECLDLRGVDYDAIAMLNVSAKQALADQNDELKQKVAAAHAKASALESEYQAQAAELTQQEEKVAALEAENAQLEAAAKTVQEMEKTIAALRRKSSAQTVALVK